MFDILVPLVERRRLDPPHVPWRHALATRTAYTKKAGEHAFSPASAQHQSNPCCRNEKYPASPTMTWSSIGIPKMRPDSLSFEVTARSASLANASPLGWLWAQIILAALARIAPLVG